MELRGYQKTALNKIGAEIVNNNKKICIVSPCGSGKSVIIAQIIKTAAAKGNQVLFLVHRKELIQQIKKTLEAFKVDFNFCDLMMVQTATKRIKDLKTPKIIVVDEAHHVLSASYLNIINIFTDAFLFGFTATPIRLKEGNLGKIFETMVKTVSVRWLIQNKYLSAYKYFGVKLAETGNLKIKRGDFDKQEIAEIMEKDAIYGQTLSNWERLAKDKKTIVYCSSVESSKETARSFQRSGYIAKHIDAKTPKFERERAIKNFRNGIVKILCNVNLFDEGFDVPDCECVVLLRPTQSLSLFIQQSMRSMRHKRGKTAVIIDHVNNANRHGLPCMERKWSLDKKQNQENDDDEKVKTCDYCFFVYDAKIFKCPNCGEIKEKELRLSEEREIVEAELEELTIEDFAYMVYNDYKKMQSFEQLALFQKARGYKFVWTLFKCIELNLMVPEKYKKQLKKLKVVHNEQQKNNNGK